MKKFTKLNLLLTVFECGCLLQLLSLDHLKDLRAFCLKCVYSFLFIFKDTAMSSCVFKDDFELVKP